MKTAKQVDVIKSVGEGGRGAAGCTGYKDGKQFP